MPTSISDPDRFKAHLTDQALALGFAKLRICKPDAIPDAPGHLTAFLEAGHHGQMAWMQDRADWRGNPLALWPEVRSILMLAEVYEGPKDHALALKDRNNGILSAYAQGKDYHDLVKRRLKHLGRWLLEKAGGEIKVFVDTAPVMEKPLAQAAGLGWQGKHTNLLARDLGNWFFLGAIFTTLDLPPDLPEVSHCGSCTSCLDACPTKAFPAPYRLDARRCISYLTIEHKGQIEPHFRPLIGNRIYGCDDCLAVCPWNKFAANAHDIGYAHRHGAPALADLAGLDEPGFRQRFAGTPIKRIGHARFLRNVLYAIGNSGNPDLLPALDPWLGHADDVLRDAAQWARDRLSALGPAGGLKS